MFVYHYYMVNKDFHFKKSKMKNKERLPKNFSFVFIVSFVLSTVVYVYHLNAIIVYISWIEVMQLIRFLLTLCYVTLNKNK